MISRMWQEIKNIYHGVEAILASIYYGFPAHKIKVIGVTGTDGKTTTTHLIHHILTSSGYKASFVSSVNAQIGTNIYDMGFHVTTPNAWTLQRLLRMAIKNHDQFLILEVTSHAIDQLRIWGINFDIVLLTNVTHEHLDYHKNYLAYLHTKERLLKKAKIAIFNKDDESYLKINFRQYNNQIITYALKKNADVNLIKFPFSTVLPGDYNLSNCLAAITVCYYSGVSKKHILKAVKSFTGVIGRFEKISNQRGIEIIIDFAHTPNGLAKLLNTIKSQAKNRIIHVFGAAGLRDYTKRPIMGKVSASYADLIVLTEEDYRTENIENIIESIAQGCKQKKAIEWSVVGYKQIMDFSKPIFFRIPDRQQAINFAINKLARKKDTVVITGKSHEKSICRGKIEYPWSEYQAVKKALTE